MQAFFKLKLLKVKEIIIQDAAFLTFAYVTIQIK